MLKTAPINLRALEAQKKLIDYAAGLVGKNRSDFILDASCAAAENTVLDKTVFSLGDSQYQEFLKLLEQPAVHNAGLEKLMNIQPAWER